MELYDVFISYRRSDGLKVAEALYHYLTQKGLRVFWDKEKMEYGKGFPEQLKGSVWQAPTYVLIVTKDVFSFREETDGNKDWVLEEIRTAIEAHEQIKDHRLCVLDPIDGFFPEEKDLPDCVKEIGKIHRVPLSENHETAFREVFRQATQVTPSNLWNAAHRWFYGSKRDEGRFSRLNICQGILPNVDREHRQTDIPIYTSIASQTDGQSPEVLPLLDAVTRTSGHLYLIGQGGIGKTTSLMHIISGAYENSIYTPGTPIPIFVELSFAPDSPGPLYNTQVASFIRRSVYRQLRTDLQAWQDPSRGTQDTEEVFSLPDEVAVKPISDLFCRRTEHPEFLLLLDGLNEVSTVAPEGDRTIMEMVTGEINFLMRHCPNVRIILTSRSDDTDIGGNAVTRLHLTGIDADAAREYLAQQGFSSRRIGKALSDPDLAKTLQIPLFLTMYAALSQDNTATAQGEILRLFFHERSRNLELYTNQDRLLSMEENAGDAARQTQKLRITARMFHFMLDFILPELACYMEKKGLFYISDEDAQRLITDVLQQTGPTAICGSTGKALFVQYRKSGSRRAHVLKTAMDLRQTLGEGDSEDWELITDNILTCCMTTLGILQETNGRCGFVHQHIRDYFAAARHINTLRLSLHLQEQGEQALALSCMEPLFRDAPVGMTVRKFIGEYLGEHKNKPTSQNGTHRYGVPEEPCDRNLIDRLLELYRDRFGGKDGYVLYSLLKILTEVRGVLAGCDLSRLDLTGCDLNGAGLGIYGLATNVQGAKLSGEELFFHGHTNSIESLDYSPDGKRILSGSSEGTICIQDASTGALLHRVTAPGKLLFAAFTQNGNGFISASIEVLGNSDGYAFAETCQGSVAIWDGKDKQPSASYQFDQSFFTGAAITPDKSRLLLWNNTTLWCFSVAHLVPDYQFDLPPQIQIKSGFIYDQETLLLSCTLAPPNTNQKSNLLFDLSAPRFSSPPQDLQYAHLKAFTSRNGLRFAVVFQEEQHILKCQRPGSDTFLTIDTLDQDASTAIYDLKLSSSGQWLALGDGKNIRIYNAKSLQLVKSFNSHTYPGYPCIAFSDARQQLVLGTNEGSLQIHDTREFLLHWKKTGALSYISAYQYAPDGSSLAVLNSDGLLTLWDAQKKQLLNARKFEKAASRKLFFSPDGSKLCHSSRNHSAILRVPDLEVLFSCPGEAFFSPDGAYLACVGYGESNIYDGCTYQPILSLPGSLILDFMGDRILAENICTANTGRGLRRIRESHSVINLVNGVTIKELRFEGAQTRTAAACSKFIAVGTKVGEIRILNANTYELIARYSCFEGEHPLLRRLVFSQDGRFLLENYSGFSVLRETDHFSVYASKSGGTDSVHLSPNGSFLIHRYSNNDNSTTFFSTETLQPILNTNSGFLTGNFCSTDRKESHIALLEKYKRLAFYRLNGSDEAQREWELSPEPGLDVLGLDLRRLHPDSPLTSEQRETLRLYGAIIE